MEEGNGAAVGLDNMATNRTQAPATLRAIRDETAALARENWMLKEEGPYPHRLCQIANENIGNLE